MITGFSPVLIRVKVSYSMEEISLSLFMKILKKRLRLQDIMNITLITGNIVPSRDRYKLLVYPTIQDKLNGELLVVSSSGILTKKLTALNKMKMKIFEFLYLIQIKYAIFTNYNLQIFN